MRRPNRSVEIFSLSALDLFASAMGAFILITIIVLPDYQKVARTLAEVDALKQSVSDLEQQNETLQNALDQGRTSALLGIVTSAKRLVFVIDTSGSMEAYRDRLAAISAQAIAGLQPDQEIQILGFSSRGTGSYVTRWLTPNDMTAMTDPNKLAASAFIDGLARDFDGGTPTEFALNEAMDYDAQAIVLVTDGAPNDTNTPEEFVGLIDRITALNGGKKEIHTIGIGDYTTDTMFRDFLQNLSSKNDGQFLGY